MVTIVPPILGFEKPLNENGGRKPSLGLVLVCSGCSNRQENTGEPEVSEQNVSSEGERREDSETDREADTDVGESSEGAARSIPETLEQIPEGYDAPADQQEGTLKHVIDHAIQDGRMQPMIIVCPTYNNTSPEDSSSYSLAFRLTDNYHNELVNDLIPAVEGRYSSYAEDTSPEGVAASRMHRGFGGFSMGSVATWHTFQYCLDDFYYFMPMSGSFTTDGDFMSQIVTESGYGPEDFFIYAMSGTDDFAYSAFARQIEAMLETSDGNFVEADNEKEGNLVFRVQEGGTHNGEYAEQYIYNGLCWFWN